MLACDPSRVAGRKWANERAAGATADEVFEITAGRLGPIKPVEIAVRPLTVLVGRQGTGKSLVAQLLYFFRGLPGLVRLDVASRRAEENAVTPEAIVRRIIDGLRSSHRSFARLTVPSVALRWEGSLAAGGVHGKRCDFKLNIQSKTSKVNPSKSLVDCVQKICRARTEPPLSAVFVPTERLLYAMQLAPTSIHVMSAPRLLDTFASVMDVAGRIQSDWEDGIPDTAQGRWVRDHLLEALAGEARLRGSSWRWIFRDGGKARSIDLDMASSGQRANAPLSLLPQALFSLRARGDLTSAFTLYVEEPEIHLHPAAERAVVEVLAFLVNNGFRVVLTTHSLTVLYTINNLLLASDLPRTSMAKEIAPDIRLRADDVAAYHLLPDGEVATVIGDSGTIDERALGRVADDLAMEMNKIFALKAAAKRT